MRRSSSSLPLLDSPAGADGLPPHVAEECAPFAPFRPLGVSRISFGLVSTVDDVAAFVAFVKRFFVSAHGVLAPGRGAPRSVPAAQQGDESAVKLARLAELYICPSLLSFLVLSH